MAKGFANSSYDGDLPSSFIEISIDPNLLNNFANEDSINAYFNSFSSTEEFQKLRQRLLDEVFNIIENYLTDKQREVVKMTYLEGKTQNEISSALGKHQTTIHKLLQDNIDYNNDKKRYGGALKKIRKLCASSDIIQGILKEIRDKNRSYVDV